MTTARDSFEGHSLYFWHSEFGFLENAGDPREVQIWEAEQDMQIDLTRNRIQNERDHIIASPPRL